MVEPELPRGYRFSVASAGIKYKDRPDMALIYSEKEAAVAGTFTSNRVKAAPVVLDMRRIRSGLGRAIVVNSGNANACTGDRGLRDAERTCRKLAERLGIPEKSVLVASTGIIGTPLPMDRIDKGLKTLAEGSAAAGLKDVATAIMTTDKFPKYGSRKVCFGRTRAVLAGVAKGAGMISPDMATMLCFLLTDLAIEKGALKRALKETVDRTFNLITVDGDMSTNDTVIMMANGRVGNRPLTEGSIGYRRFREELFSLMDEFARMIVRDGEGATALVTVRLRGARNRSDARKAAFSVAKSPLVKTALHGRDPNWGRIMAALGYSGAFFREDSVDISVNGVRVVRRGIGTGRDGPASEAMKGEEVLLDINLNAGRESVKVYTCDLTGEYVRINADYRS